MKLEYLFLDYILDVLNEFNTTFQADQSMVGYLHAEMTSLRRKFMGKFIQSRVITVETDFTTVDFKSGDYQLPDNILAVGLKTRELLHPDNNIPPEIITKFYRMNPFLFIVHVSVGELAKRLGYSCELDELQDQYQDFELSPMEELPSFPSDCRLDDFWIWVEVTLADSRQRFPLLSQPSLVALSLPHSNTDTERSFSIVKKIQTDMRENLSHKTVHSLILLKKQPLVNFPLEQIFRMSRQIGKKPSRKMYSVSVLNTALLSIRVALNGSYLEEENQLAQWVIDMAKIGYGRTRQEVLTTVKKILDGDKRNNPFKDNRPGKDWYYAFMKRHPEISERSPIQLGKERAVLSKETVGRWFDDFKEYMNVTANQELLKDPTRLYNADESGFPLCPKTGRVLGAKGSKVVYNFTSSNKTEITVMACMSASGHYLPPMIVYPGQRFTSNLLEGFQEATLGRSQNGWMDSELFVHWLKEVFVPGVNERVVTKPVVLFLFVDGHSTHLTLQASDICRENGIILYCLPPHSSRVCSL
ncbi:hypothetical protein ScPMuIL_009369 [Solemya velum]